MYYFLKTIISSPIQNEIGMTSFSAHIIGVVTWYILTILLPLLPLLKAFGGVIFPFVSKSRSISQQAISFICPLGPLKSQRSHSSRDKRVLANPGWIYHRSYFINLLFCYFMLNIYHVFIITCFLSRVQLFYLCDNNCFNYLYLLLTFNQETLWACRINVGGLPTINILVYDILKSRLTYFFTLNCLVLR